MKKRHKGFRAFTLAEVLITLAIIGVVAAMTIPTLMGVFQKEVCYRGFQKEYSVLSQAIQQLVTENDDFGGASEAYGNGIKALQSKIKVIKFCQAGPSKGECFAASYDSLDGGTFGGAFEDYDAMAFADGAVIGFNDWGGNPCNGTWGNLTNTICGELTLDINGAKKPNVMGRDLFVFIITQDKLVPLGSEGIFTYDADNTWYCNKEISDPNAGKACATRLLQEGRFTY